MKIKNKEDLKKCQIVCREREDTKSCLNMLEELGFNIEKEYYKTWNIIFWGSLAEGFIIHNTLRENLKTEFYNKKFIKILKKLINEEKEKEEQEKEKKEKVEDIEVAGDGRIIKINNKQSKKEIFIACDWTYREEKRGAIKDLKFEYLDYLLKYCLAYATKEAKDKAQFKLEIETKLKNIAERLNNGRKIDWKDENQKKFFICYDFYHKYLDFFSVATVKTSAVIYCLDRSFLKVAIQEIGEENLIKYFTE